VIGNHGYTIRCTAEISIRNWNTNSYKRLPFLFRKEETSKERIGTSMVTADSS
jgi:hypothetical protein